MKEEHGVLQIDLRMGSGTLGGPSCEYMLGLRRVSWI